MTQIIEDVYNGRDNTIDLLLTEDGVSITHGDITRVVVALNDDDDTEIDSSTSPSAFDWANDKLILSLGGESIPAGSYNADIFVYTSGNPNGIQWEPKVGIRVTAA